MEINNSVARPAENITDCFIMQALLFHSCAAWCILNSSGKGRFSSGELVYIMAVAIHSDGHGLYDDFMDRPVSAGLSFSYKC